MKTSILVLGLIYSTVTFSASQGSLLKGSLRGYDTEYATIINETGTYKVPVEYFSNVKKIALGSAVSLQLSAEDFEKVKMDSPKVLILSKNKNSK